MKIQTKIPAQIGFQLAPMLDIVFLLLIFFVVTQKIILTEQDLNVKVPTAPSSEDEVTRAIDEIIINVREEDGKLIVTVDGTTFTLDQLRQRLRKIVSNNEDVPVRIRGDAKTSWQGIADVIAACTDVGVYNISFSSRLPKGEGAAP